MKARRPGLSVLEDLARDGAFAARTLLRAPGFAVAVLSLGLSVGALAAVLGTADWLLGRPAGGVVEPDRVVGLRLAEPGRPDLGTFGFSFPQYLALREAQDAFEEIASYGKLAQIVSNGAETDQRVVEMATGEYFGLLGLLPEVGRLFGPEDDREGAEPVAVLSHAFWQSWFGGAEDVVGRTIEVRGTEVRVIGVAPRAFEGYTLDWVGPTDVWMPMRSLAALGQGGGLTAPVTFWATIGRLAPGASVAAASARAGSWMTSIPPVESPSFVPDSIVVRPSSEMRISRRAEARTFLGTLGAVGALILLAACFNVANFVLGRAALRRREIALRAAMGATRSRIARQLLAEALTVAAAVAGTGGALGIWIGRLLAPLPSIYLGIQSRGAGLTTDGAVDAQLLGAVVALAAVTSIAFGMLPMAAAFRRPLEAISRQRARWSWGRLRFTARHPVLVLQIALAALLMVCAGLFGRTLGNVAAVDPELSDPGTLLLARIVPFDLTAEEGTAFYQSLFGRLEALPQVRSLSIGWNPPFRQGRGPVGVPGIEGSAVRSGLTAVAPGFFETLGQPIVAGRDLGPVDEDAGSIVLNYVLAERLFPGQDPIGRSVTYPGSEPRVVVGVVARDRCESLLEREGSCAWRPFPMGTSTGYLRVRTSGPAEELAPVLGEIVRALGPGVAVTEQQTGDAFLRDMTGAQRVTAVASGGLALFGVVLLVLGCVSLFVSLVRDSIGEIAVRMALGATGARITREVSAHGFALVLVGTAAGLLASRALTPLLAERFYEVSPTDSLTFLTVALSLPVIAMASVGWAAATATRTRPADHLRGV